jgi:hypothetical protein
MCHSFQESGGAELVLYDDLGSLDWIDIGVIQAPAGFPQSCFGTPGFVYPAFYPTAVIYATPGCTKAGNPTGYQCNPPSSVAYTIAGSTGVTTSTQDSFSNSSQFSLTATASVTDAAFLDATQVSATFGFTVAQTQGTSTALSRTTSNSVSWAPQSPDGIYHDWDYIQGIVNPAIMLENWMDPVTGQNNIEWELGVRAADGTAIPSGAAIPYDYTVFEVRCLLAGHYKLPRTFPGGPPSNNLALIYDPNNTCANDPTDWLPSNAPPGLQVTDYEQMLTLDPFWNADPTQPLSPLPSARYTYQYNFPYLPPQGPNSSSCLSQLFNQGLVHTDTFSISTKVDTTFSASTTIGDPKVLDLKNTDSWEWSDMTTTQTTNTNSATATATIMCSSANWTGPGDIGVYWDNTFDTYLFALQDFPAGRWRNLLSGNVTLVNGASVPGMPVELTIGTTATPTATDNNGHFVFYVPDTGQVELLSATLSVGGVSQPVILGSHGLTIEIPQPPPVLAVYSEGSPSGGGDNRLDRIPMRVTNLSGVSTATNVTVTAITPNNASIVYEPGELTIPFVIPGGAALKPGDTSSFNLDFTDTSGTAPAPFSFVIKMKADNVPEFSTTINVR